MKSYGKAKMFEYHVVRADDGVTVATKTTKLAASFDAGARSGKHFVVAQPKE